MRRVLSLLGAVSTTAAPALPHRPGASLTARSKARSLPSCHLTQGRPLLHPHDFPAVSGLEPLRASSVRKKWSSTASCSLPADRLGSCE